VRCTPLALALLAVALAVPAVEAAPPAVRRCVRACRQATEACAETSRAELRARQAFCLGGRKDRARCRKAAKATVRPQAS
jgi:hypothetical protein